MSQKRRTGPLNPEGTRNDILEAAFTLLAKNGQKGVSFSEVARLANVDRGTAHRHFQSREGLLKATAEKVSEKLTDAIFGENLPDQKTSFQSTEIMEQNQRLIKFGMDSPELCRIWLFEVLSSDDPMKDFFWRTFLSSYAGFAKTEAAQENLNVEVLAIIMLAGSFLWPIWIGAHAKSDAEKQVLAEGFSKEMLRLSMYGSLKPEFFPEIAEMLNGASDKKPKKNSDTA